MNDSAYSKTCISCKETKPLSSFNKRKDAKDGYRNKCMDCIKEYNADKKDIKKVYNKQYQENNKEEIAKTKKEYYANNKDDIFAYQKEYNQKNKTIISNKRHIYYTNNKEMFLEINNKNEKKRMKNDPAFRAKKLVSEAIRKIIKSNGGQKSNTTFNILPYTAQELVKHLKTTCDIDTTDLHIDHIIPHSMFEYDSLEHPNCKLAWKLTNLQFLPAAENIKLGDKGFGKMSIEQVKVEMRRIYTEEEIQTWIPPKKLEE